jgi:hypothetical protein
MLGQDYQTLVQAVEKLQHSAQDNAEREFPPLPVEPEKAVNQLCKLTRKMLDLAERESQALIQNDLLAFCILQEEKDSMSHEYLKASQEFRTRLNEFYTVDKSMLSRLENFQNKLGERTNDNNKLIAFVKDRAEKNTYDARLMAQEYSRQGKGNGKALRGHRG